VFQKVFPSLKNVFQNTQFRKYKNTFHIECFKRYFEIHKYISEQPFQKKNLEQMLRIVFLDPKWLMEHSFQILF